MDPTTIILIIIQRKVTGCPNKHGNSVTTFTSSSLHEAFFHEQNYCSIPA